MDKQQEKENHSTNISTNTISQNSGSILGKRSTETNTNPAEKESKLTKTAEIASIEFGNFSPEEFISEKSILLTAYDSATENTNLRDYLSSQWQQNMETIKELEIVYSTLNGQALEEITKFLASCRQIKKLNFTGVQMISDSIQILTQFLKLNDSIETLVFSHMDLDINDLGLIMQSLAQNHTLKKLSLSACQLDDIAAELIFHNIFNSVIEKLDLSSNNITLENAPYLHRLDIINDELEKIRLNHSKITDQAIGTLVKLVQQNPMITEIELYGNEFSLAGQTQLTEFNDVFIINEHID